MSEKEKELRDREASLLTSVLNVIQSQYGDIINDLRYVKHKLKTILEINQWEMEFLKKAPAYKTLAKEGLV